MLYSKHLGYFFCSIAVSLFYSLSFPFLCHSQDNQDVDAIFVLKGYARLESGVAAEGVEIEMKKDGQSITTLTTSKTGKYYIEMPVSVLNKNNEYLLFVSLPGTIPKSISVNTYISPEEFNENTFPRYVFDLEIKMIETTMKQIVVERASGRIHWDFEQHAFAFDQSYAKIIEQEDNSEKILAEKRKKEEEEARHKAEEAFNALADKKAKEEADKILQKNLEAMRLQMRQTRMKDSLDSLTNAQKANLEIVNITKPISPEDVDENAFDGTDAYSINIAKKSLKISQAKTNKEKAANLSAKYETNNTLTSLLNMVDEYDKSKKLKVKSQKQ